MTITPTVNWTRAMERAMRNRLKPTKTVDGTYRVRSTSRPGAFHIVSLDATGHITDCSDCQGWQRYGRQNPCKHAGAVALAVAYVQGASIVPQRTADPVVYNQRGRHQLFREVA